MSTALVEMHVCLREALSQLCCLCRVFRHLAGEQAHQEDFLGTFMTSYALSMSLQRMHTQAEGSLPASLDAALAPGHLLAVCLDEQRLVQAPPANSSELAGLCPCHYVPLQQP